MKIAVCIKQVVTREWQLRINDGKSWIRDQDASFELNEPDAYALEEALRPKEKHTGEVVVVSAGPARAAQVIREALARGADRAIHIEADALATADAVSVADAIASAIREEKVDLVLTGLQSDDQGFGQVGVILDPLRDDLFEVIDGSLAKHDGEPLRGSTHEDLATALVATGFAYDAGVRARQAEIAARLLPRVADIRRMGAAALELAWTAAGRYDAFYEYGLNAWDLAAGEMMCATAGLAVRRLAPLPHTAPGVLVAPAAIVDELAAIVSG